MHKTSFDVCLPLLEDAATLDHLQPVHVDELVNSLLMLLDVLKEVILTPNTAARVRLIS